MTWEEFLSWCNEGQSDWVDGKGISYVSNSTLHARRVAFLVEPLRLFVRVFDLGEVFSEHALRRLPTRPSGRMPDIFVIGRNQPDRVHHQWVEGPALMGIEYLTEDSFERDLVEKRAEYERAGMPEYPIIDVGPGRREFLYLRLDDIGNYREVAPDERGHSHSDALPGFWLDPEWFWHDPLLDVGRLLTEIAPLAYQAHLLSILEQNGAR